jgi:tetratricopeptide (TPR) repeat protein
MNLLTDALQLQQNQKFVEAEKLFTELLQNGETDTKIHQHLAECQVQLQKIQEAIETLETGLTITPEKTELLSLTSRLYWGIGQKEKAIVYYEQVVSFSQQQTDVLFNLASMYYDVKRLEDAIQVFNQVLAIAPHIYQAHFNKGMTLVEVARYEEAITSFREGLKPDPNNSFGNLQLGMALHVSGEASQALKYYTIAYENANNDQERTDALTLQANAQRDLGDMEAAKILYEKALIIDSKNEVASANLAMIAKKTIPTWHFDMLADTARNEAYDKAISSAVKAGDIVLDIGTGSGLLSMMAARAGATNITAVEMVPELAEVARMVITDNNFEKAITVHEKRSSALVVGEDMTEKANVVVSEILDTGLLGEGVLPSMRHAWGNLLHDNATCIPKSADIYAVLIQCDKYHLVNPVKEIQGFDLSAFNHFRAEKSYLVMHSSQMKSKDLSAVFPVLSVDFYNLPELATPENPNRHSMEVEITEEGRMHGIMFWFTLHVDDEISMSSGPNGEMVHWGQALYMFDDEQVVKPGDKVAVTALQSESVVTFEKG